MSTPRFAPAAPPPGLPPPGAAPGWGQRPLDGFSPAVLAVLATLPDAWRAGRHTPGAARTVRLTGALQK